MNCPNCDAEIPIGVSYFEDCCQECVDWEHVNPEDHFVMVDMTEGVLEEFKYDFINRMPGFYPVRILQKMKKGHSPETVQR